MNIYQPTMEKNGVVKIIQRIITIVQIMGLVVNTANQIKTRVARIPQTGVKLPGKVIPLKISVLLIVQLLMQIMFPTAAMETPV